MPPVPPRRAAAAGGLLARTVASVSCPTRGDCDLRADSVPSVFGADFGEAAGEDSGESAGTDGGVCAGCDCRAEDSLSLADSLEFFASSPRRVRKELASIEAGVARNTGASVLTA